MGDSQPRKTKRSDPKHAGPRLQLADVRRIADFTPWWLQCAQCSQVAFMWPDWEAAEGQCRCFGCGAQYSLKIGRYVSSITALPLWFRKHFRNRLFWAANEEHLNYLERMIGTELRERPKEAGRRMAFSMAMPFNLPAWMLSAKNRTDLLRLIEQLRQRK